ncbi:LOB domain-containing protein 1 [Forsythia ovata]|uniref:LOB domain-containing protein 1 n=1 Tax=Forsythia ovata TaxID=205694 RepID=A0ABD1X075_9LAMI
MEDWETAASAATTSSLPPQVVISPCAACKILRRRCVEKCTLAPYFPPTEPLKFAVAHRVFGASNIIKLLQGVPESQRADAVDSMVYEANARMRDPVYGCAGAICQLQKQIIELQTELAKAEAQILNMKSHNMIDSAETLQYQESIIQQQPFDNSSSFFFDANNVGLDNWEPFWK